MNFDNEREEIIAERKTVLAKITITSNQTRKKWLYYECLEPLNKRLVELNRKASV